jgi:aminocarboxymuconate-semialdehyde decarboxylase
LIFFFVTRKSHAYPTDSRSIHVTTPPLSTSYPERFPKLKLAFAHGGGAFPYTLGRIEKGFTCRPDLVAVDNPVNPREYLGRFWTDSLVHDAKALRYLVDVIGSKRVCLGSDYPFPLGEQGPGGLVETAQLGKGVTEDIFHNAALEFLGISREEARKRFGK